MSASACACAASAPQGPRRAGRAPRSELVGLAGSFDKKPHQLSGGQRQRVALARALVVEPAVLLLDEPLGALDLKLRRQMQDELKAIQRRVGTAFVHVTHDQEEAMALADHCVVMNEGRIEDEGPPERVYARPATRFSATFMGESTMLPAEVTAATARAVRVRTSARRIQHPRRWRARLAGRPRHPSRASPSRLGRWRPVARQRHRDGRGVPGQLQARAGRLADRSGDPLHCEGAAGNAGRAGRNGRDLLPAGGCHSARKVSLEWAFCRS